MGKKKRRTRRGFGAIRQLPSGRYQASYIGPDLVRYNGPTTFQAAEDAEAWLAARRNEIRGGGWMPASTLPPVSLREYADRWLAQRDLRPGTRAHYEQLLRNHINPALGSRALRRLTPSDVETWYYSLGARHPTRRAHAYGLLRTILGDAVYSRAIDVNPCHIRGAGTSRRVKQIKPATLSELEDLASAMPERLRMMVPLSAWCGLRFGEVTELRGRDIVNGGERISITRAVTRVRGDVIIGKPKSDAGVRDVAVPPHLRDALQEHISHFVDGPEVLLFPAADGWSHLARSTLTRSWDKARAEAGRPDLRFHDLRHTGAVFAAQSGATHDELKARLGHSSSAAAMLYQHVAEDRDLLLAQRMSEMVGGATGSGSK